MLPEDGARSWRMRTGQYGQSGMEHGWYLPQLIFFERSCASRLGDFVMTFSTAFTGRKPGNVDA